MADLPEAVEANVVRVLRQAGGTSTVAEVTAAELRLWAEEGPGEGRGNRSSASGFLVHDALRALRERGSVSWAEPFTPETAVELAPHLRRVGR